MKCKTIAILCLLFVSACGGKGGDTSVTVTTNQNQNFNSADGCFEFCGEDEDCVEEFNCANLPSEEPEPSVE